MASGGNVPATEGRARFSVESGQAAHSTTTTRRQSLWSGAAGKRRMSRKTVEVLLEPTYRMEPKVKFSSERVERLLYAILYSRLQPLETQRTSVSSKSKVNLDELTLSITDEIRSSIRDMSYERYRLVVVVSLFELFGGVADVMFASRCLWDPQFDTFAEATVSTQNIYAVAVVYAVYCE